MFASILDFTKGFGHTETLTVSGPGLATMDPARTDNWGFDPRAR